MELLNVEISTAWGVPALVLCAAGFSPLIGCLRRLPRKAWQEELRQREASAPSIRRHIGLLLLLAMVFALVFRSCSRGSRLGRGKKFARAALILESMAGIAQAILILIGICSGVSGSLWEIGTCLCFLAGAVLLLRGFWILPELPLFLPAPIQDPSRQTVQPEERTEGKTSLPQGPDNAR